MGLRECTLALAAVAGAAAGHAQTAQFIALGDLPGGDFFSDATAVSADGTTVVGFSGVDPYDHSFRWTAEEGMVDLGVIDDSPVSRAYGVSGDGAVVVGEQVGGSFRWTAATGMEFVSEELNARGSNEAYAISADGSTIVGISQQIDPFESQAFRCVNGGSDLLGSLPCGDPWSYAQAVSADGTIVVGGDFSCDYQAFRWTTGTGLQALAFPEQWEWTQAFGISGDGGIIVGYGLENHKFHAFRYDGSGPASLGDLPGGDDRSVALAASQDGSTIVGYSEGDLLEDEAFVWKAGQGMRALRQILDERGVTTHKGWRIDQANAVSGDGSVIVGWGTNPDGKTEGWMARLCNADLNGDGALDLFDFLGFVNLFNAGDVRADCDGSGVLDLFDFLCFVNRFNAGC